MRHFAVIHNIPSPYRLHLFTVMSRGLERRGLRLRVHFMSRGHHDRPHWSWDPEAAGFDATFWRDVGPVLRQKEWHLNPALLRELRRAAPDVVLVGGPWDSLTGVASAMLLPSSSRKIAWIEGNTRTPGRTRGVTGRAKRFLLERFDFVAVPGREGVAFARLFIGDRPPLALLPNLVDESRFRNEPDPEERNRTRSELGVEGGERLAIWNARLIPAKNVTGFLRSLRPQDLRGWRLVILGEGPLASEVERVIAEGGLQAHVRRLPYVPYERMPSVYAAADLMVLPSLHDPNPLSVVEGMHAGLPLVVSDRIGNHPEAIVEGESGWTLDPTSPDSMRQVLRTALATPPGRLLAMGERSREIAARHWTSERAMDRFLDSVLGVA